jgi:hypothetical protein
VLAAHRHDAATAGVRHRAERGQALRLKGARQGGQGVADPGLGVGGAMARPLERRPPSPCGDVEALGRKVVNMAAWKSICPNLAWNADQLAVRAATNRSYETRPTPRGLNPL